MRWPWVSRVAFEVLATTADELRVQLAQAQSRYDALVQRLVSPPASAPAEPPASEPPLPDALAQAVHALAGGNHVLYQEARRVARQLAEAPDLSPEEQAVALWNRFTVEA